LPDLANPLGTVWGLFARKAGEPNPTISKMSCCARLSRRVIRESHTLNLSAANAARVYDKPGNVTTRSGEVVILFECGKSYS
jgi:hypothetical protein